VDRIEKSKIELLESCRELEAAYARMAEAGIDALLPGARERNLEFIEKLEKTDLTIKVN
jgi:hypothetical protein